jgi:hypothetical protein
MRRTLLTILLGASTATPVWAQGALAVQGWGFPTGQLSAASLAVGGGTAETDPASPLNPANMGRATRYSIYMQYEPEFRSTTINGTTGTSTTIRFPAFMMSGTLGRFTLGASFSTLLDRTWSNVYSDSVVIDSTLVASTLVAGSNGAMNDARFGASYWVNPRLQVGLALHAIAGENRLQFGRFFGDTSLLGDISQTSTINFAGKALSLGVIGAPSSTLLIGASMRLGGSLTAEQSREPLAEAKVPSRYGMSIAWYGITNTTISARIDRTNWSAMRDLGTPQTSVFDATDIGLGLDVVGPQMGGAFTAARLGVRDRTLPFGVNGKQVSERSLAGGIGLPLARGRGQVDLTLQRAWRTAGDAKERAWLVSIGLGIRP